MIKLIFSTQNKDKSKEEILDEWWEEIQEHKKLKKKYEKLEKEIRKYKSENTPSSAHKHLMLNTQGLQAKEGAKRGAPIGHKGITRRQIPDRKEIVDADICPKCGSIDLKDKKIFKRLIEEIPEPTVPETVEVEIHKKKCLGCGHVFIPKNNRTPLKGKFGVNLTVMIIFLKFLLRGVLRKTASFLDSNLAFKITPASVNAVIKRAALAAKKDYAELKERIRNSDKVYADETSFSVLGKKYWVWVFRTDTDILLVIRNSRGSDVIKEILGAAYRGTIICDCWSAYNSMKYAIIQRCWAHLLRKAKDYAKTVSGISFYNGLKALFDEIKTFNAGNPLQAERYAKYISMMDELSKLIADHAHCSEIADVVRYIDNKFEQWFTCIKIEGVEPTNNFAEQAIRESVIVRKIIGAFRSETGPTYYETLASLIASWQLKGLDLEMQLNQMLVQNLCFC